MQQHSYDFVERLLVFLNRKPDDEDSTNKRSSEKADMNDADNKSTVKVDLTIDDYNKWCAGTILAHAFTVYFDVIKFDQNCSQTGRYQA
eukprot:SAG31_NODE_13696_length_852_cov_1.727756_2_plen_89_part_00